MHELGVLLQAVRTVDRMARSRQIDCVSFMTLSVGRESDYVPAFFEKLFPVQPLVFSRKTGHKFFRSGTVFRTFGVLYCNHKLPYI